MDLNHCRCLYVRETSVFKRNKDVSWRRLDRRCVLINVATGECFELNDLGSRIWDALDHDRSTAEVCELVAPAADAPLVRDAESFLQQLAAHGLVERVTRPQIS
jgi:hypothetical protein